MVITSPKTQKEDIKLDLTLRPKVFEEFVGQEKIKRNLCIFMESAKKRKEPLEHVLLYGCTGLGKTTLAYIIAEEMKVGLKVTSGPAIEKAGDLGAILTNLKDGDVLFIDECHRLNRVVEEALYSAMEEYVLDIIIGKGPSARTLRLDLPRFSLIGATTRLGLLTSPFRGRFGTTYQLDFYTTEDIEKIIARSSKILGVKIEPKAITRIAFSSRATPRVANRLLKRVRDFALVKADGLITEKVAGQALSLIEVDRLGLEPTDRRILKAMIDKFNGGPVGLKALAAATSEEEGTIEDIYEPYLLQIGFLARTPRGRVATRLAYKHLGLKLRRDQSQLL